MKHLLLPLLATTALLTAGCANDPYANNAGLKQGAVAGGALGALAGAIIGNQSGRALEGAAIGGTIGAVSGGALGSAHDNRNAGYQQNPNGYNNSGYAPAPSYGYPYGKQ